MNSVIIRLILISTLFLVSCASKVTISEAPEYLKNIDKDELKQLVSWESICAYREDKYR